MRPHGGAIQNQVFHIRVISKLLVHVLPDQLVAPTGEAFLNAVPVTIFFGSLPPLGTSAQNPVNAVNKTATVGFVPGVNIRALA